MFEEILSIREMLQEIADHSNENNSAIMRVKHTSERVAEKAIDIVEVECLVAMVVAKRDACASCGLQFLRQRVSPPDAVLISELSSGSQTHRSRTAVSQAFCTPLRK